MINYELWDLKNEFTLEEVVRLWLGLDPYDGTFLNEYYKDIKVFNDVLCAALKTGTCKNKIDEYYRYRPPWISTSSDFAFAWQKPASSYSGNEYLPPDYRIDRQSLVDYANHIKHKPAFLFPEVRTHQKPLPQTTQESKDMPAGHNVFRWKDGTWEITFDGKTIRPSNSLGLRYINYLLKYPNPEKEIHVNKLKSITENSEEAKQTLKSKGKNVGTAEGLEETNLKDDFLDKDTITNYKQRIEKLTREKEDAEELGNDERVAEIQDDIEKIKGELKRSMGKGGKSRKFTDATERNRIAITNCIRDALDKIKEAHPSLREHLKTIKTGEKCAYKPETNINWNL